MDRNVVIGMGNLGIDLVKEFKSRNIYVDFFTKSNGFKYPCSLNPIFDTTPNHVWLTIGAGSVDDAEKDYIPFIDLHLRMVMDFVKQLPEHVTLHIFSTDYVKDTEIRSLYALSKKQMEDTLLFINRPNTYIYRVGTLYGEWKKCFPSKLLQNIANQNIINLPVNRVKPTATKWLATILTNLHFTKIYNYLKPFDMILDIAPKGDVSIYDWGKMILPHDVKCTYKYDLKRPEECKLNSFFYDSWEDVWNMYNIWTARPLI